MNAIIYKSTNKKDGKFYIGQTIQKLSRRINRHKNDSRKPKTYFHRAINVHNIDNFEWEIIDTALTLEELHEKEIQWIRDTSATNPEIGYNTTSGGNGGDTLSKHPNIKEIGGKISTKRKGIKQSKNHIEKRINARKTPIEIDGVLYNSQLDASKQIGVSNSLINIRLKSDNFPNYKYLPKGNK